MLDRLIADSRRHITAMESTSLRNLKSGAVDAGTYADYVKAHPDESSYHVLLALRRLAADDYERLPADVKAGILCSALSTQTHLNDWGYLGPAESYDGEAAQALLRVGGDAKRRLTSLLDDRRPAPLFGGEEATLSSLYHYRRCDFAYRYLSLIIGTVPRFDADTAQRDAAIASLRTRLIAG